MNNLTDHHGLRVAAALSRFIEDEAMPGTGIDAATFWHGFSALVHDLAPQNRALLAERDRLQAALDEWHRAHPGPVRDLAAYRAFLEQIGYLVPPPARFQITTRDVDQEISEQAGPQLVVPLSNARYALNAANARWGSLYDALYGTDALPVDEDGAGKSAGNADGASPGGGYDPVRGARVIDYARAFLDHVAPLASGSHRDATRYAVHGGQLRVETANGETGLAAPAQFAGFKASPTHPRPS